MTITKGSFDVYSGNIYDQDIIQNPPANGSILIADSTQTTGWKSATSAALKASSATLVAGTVTVSDITVTASSQIFLTAKANTIIGCLQVTSQTVGVGFTIDSSVNTDSGLTAYLIVG